MTTVEAAQGMSVHRGRTQISSKALGRVVTAISAEALGVSSGSPRIELVDSNGDLSLVVSSAIRVAALSTSEAGAPVRQRTVLEHASQAQTEIQRRVAELTGSRVTRVVIRITGAEIRQERRVR